MRSNEFNSCPSPKSSSHSPQPVPVPIYPAAARASRRAFLVVPRWRRFVLVALFGLFLISLAEDWAPWLRGYKPWPPEWRWTHQVGDYPSAAIVLLLFGVAGIAIVSWATRPGARTAASRATAALLALYAMLFGFQIAASWIRTPRITYLWAERTTTNWTNSFFSASLVPDRLGGIWSRFDTLFDEEHFPRVVTHPPGFITYYAGIRRSLEVLGVGEQEGESVAFWRRAVAPLAPASRLSGSQLLAALLATLLLPLLANLTLIPLYDLVRRQGSREAALRVACLYAAAPAMALFVPLPDQLLPLLSAVALWGFCRGCDARFLPRSPGEFRAMEATLAPAPALTPATSPPVTPAPTPTATPSPPPLAVQTPSGPNTAANATPTTPPTAPESGVEPDAIHKSFPQWIHLFVAGVALAVHSLLGYQFAVVLAILLGWRVLLTWRDTALGHRPGRAVLRLGRDASILLLPAIAVWLVLAVAFRFSYLSHWLGGVGVHRTGITEYRSYWGWLLWNPWDIVFFLGLPLATAIVWSVRRARTFASPYVIILALVVLAVDLSGTVRGETARILLFLYPFLVPLAAGTLADPVAGTKRFYLVAMCQLAQLACMALYLKLF